MGLSDRAVPRGWRTDLFSNSLSAMINAVISVVFHIRFRDKKVEFAGVGVIPLLAYLPGHLIEMFGIPPHTVDKHL